MNILTTLVGFLYFNLVSPVQMHYVYSDNPGTGYVSLHNDGEQQPIGFNTKQRKYIDYPNNRVHHKTIDDHSTNANMAKPPTTVKENKNHRAPASLKTTESPQRHHEGLNYHDSRNSLRGKTLPNQNYRTATNAGYVDYKSQPKLDKSFIVNKGNIYDSKDNIVQINVHKTQIPAEPQKVKLNSNRQLTALSVQRRDDNYKRMPASILVDKSLQKAANIKDRNSKVMSRVLDDLTKKVTDRRTKNSEYRKRDTLSFYDSKSNSNRNVISDSIKKYISKDVNTVKEQQPKETTRVGGHDEEIVESNPPYALFYRMSPESLVSQEGFYLMKSMEEQVDKVFSNKEKRLSVNYQNEVDLKKAKTKKNFNTVKLGKKVKSFLSFRSNNI